MWVASYIDLPGRARSTPALSLLGDLLSGHGHLVLEGEACVDLAQKLVNISEASIGLQGHQY